MIAWVGLGLSCLVGLGTFRTIWNLGMPKPFRYEPVKVPRYTDLVMTSDTDVKGLV